MERIADHDEKIDLVEEEVQEIAIIEEQAAIPMERIADHDEKIDLVEEEVQEIAIIEEQAAIPMERIANHDEKIDSVEEEVQEIAIIEEQAAIPMEKIADYDEKKIDLIKEKELVTETTVAKSVKEIPVEKPEIIEDEIERPAIAKIELELPQEQEEYFEPEKRVEYGEDGITDYEKFIEEELQKSLPAIIVKKIPEEPRAMREEISKNAVYEKIDRNNSARPPREPERQAREEVPAKVKRIISRKPETADVCDETCPLVKEQKERFMRKLKERQRVIDHYYLTKGFSYFEDVCTCSLACMVYALNRDPFVRSVFASLALFAVGLKLCSELDAWEMPNRIS
ncbi:probable serine/threonine-protein kinase kinX [Polyergus mexicanus]|uniref:probable serine/threonine-protein kinase kinX n=1 Tax=Polyergus mexicanus TaxID=615972 RepID=UPI0038B67C18